MIFRFFSSIFVSVCLVSILACAKKETKTVNSEGSPPDQKVELGPIKGWINGRDWKARSGRAYLRQDAFRKYLVIDLWDQELADPCLRPIGSNLAIQLKTLFQIGSWEIGSDSLRSFPVFIFRDLDEPIFNSRHNIIADTGFIGIDRIDTQVVGRAGGIFTEYLVPRTEVSGTFEVPFCGPNHALSADFGPLFSSK